MNCDSRGELVYVATLLVVHINRCKRISVRSSVSVRVAFVFVFVFVFVFAFVLVLG